MKVLITGINGFVGSHLAERLLGAGHKVCGTILPGTPLDNISGIKDNIILIDADICDPSAVNKAVSSLLPDHIYHLAAAASVADSFKAPAKTLNINVLGTINLLEAVKELSQDSKVLVAGSAEVYGEIAKDELPVSEDHPLRPINPYAVSKAAVDMFCYQYFRNYSQNIIRTRAFNHIGPRQSEGFVVSAFARQIAEIERGILPPVIKVGNLDPMRDFTDVKDVVEAYRLLIERGTAGEAYNICTGRSVSIKSVLLELLSLSSAKIKVEADPERLRPSDISVIYGDNSKLRKATGWQPKIPLTKSLEAALLSWRDRVSKGMAK